MKYTDGSEIILGDQVLISGKYKGVVAANIDRHQYSDACPQEAWEYLSSGVVIDTDFGGLVHYKEEDIAGEAIVLSSRS